MGSWGVVYKTEVYCGSASFWIKGLGRNRKCVSGGNVENVPGAVQVKTVHVQGQESTMRW